MPQPLPVLEIAAAQESHAYVVRLQGELDIAGCPALELALTDAEQSQADRILVDLENLTFTDSRGLHVLLDAAQRSAGNGNRLEMTRGTGSVAKAFRITGADTTLPFADSVSSG